MPDKNNKKGESINNDQFTISVDFTTKEALEEHYSRIIRQINRFCNFRENFNKQVKNIKGPDNDGKKHTENESFHSSGVIHKAVNNNVNKSKVVIDFENIFSIVENNILNTFAVEAMRFRNNPQTVMEYLRFLKNVNVELDNKML